MPRFAVVWSLLFLYAVSASAAEAAWIKDAAPGFELTALSGEKATLAAHKGKVVFVHFWASWCTPCKEEFPKLNELAGAYPKEDLAILAITVDKAQANIQHFISKYVPSPIKLQILRDPEGSIAQAYRNRAMPITYVLDTKGVIRYVHLGFQPGDETRWRSEIDELLREGQI